MPLTFANLADYDRIEHDNRLTFLDLDRLAPDKPVAVWLTHADGRREEFTAHHSLTREQLAWFMAGSALNVIRKASAAAGR